ncbi:hypothetical protein GCU67_00965 [Modestobacter muralis]|uniref:TerD family protein n=1 Tax=Modestobacter muralis TaxID=1608614 RepID=A0A6P0H2V7_9ACTN|nr:hypothetical protein [Modestobacter muralis]NEK92748.1 hypothetical protein [Modestobacter muralis]NEN49515.1 hypothetical protein [Modestobacter muralis]
MIGQPPASAPPRPDLGWLRHRTLRPVPGTAPAPEPPRPAAPPAPSPARSSGLDLSEPSPPARSSSAGLDLSEQSSGLDLSTPAPARRAPAPSLDLSSPLDLSGPPAAAPPAAAPPAAARRPSSSLDLGDPLDLTGPAAAPSPRASDPLSLGPTPVRSPDAPPAPVRAPAAAAPPVRRTVPRLAPGGRVILTRRDPTVTLTRVQSGVGTLTIEAIVSAAVGDVRIGALYALADGTSGLVQLATGIGTAPPHSRRPVVTGARAAHERLTVDLRQTRALRRLLVHVFSESGRELDWGGTLRVTTFGGARVEVPLDVGQHAGPVAVLSLYAIDGEFVLRAEAEPITGAVREVAAAYGYDRITWADGATPVL